MGLLRSILASLGLANEVAAVPFARDDPEMREAAERARASFGVFEARLRNPQPGDDNFMVKVALPLEGNSIETVWAGDPSQDEQGRWWAIIENRPAARGFRAGDFVEFNPTEIADWAFYTNEGLQGGYSQLVMVARLPERERERMRERFGISPDRLR